MFFCSLFLLEEAKVNIDICSVKILSFFYQRGMIQSRIKFLEVNKMKLGFLTSLLWGHSFEQVIDLASELGYSCVELACWPEDPTDQLYPGTCHLNPDKMDEAGIKYVKDYCAAKNVEIVSLAYYFNNMDPELRFRNANIAHLKKLIVASRNLGINMVTTFIGRDPKLTVEDNFKIFDEVWPDIIRFAEDNQVKVAIENCPMLYRKEEWPGGVNLASTPAVWREMFKRIPSPYFGLNLDPSHLAMQQMDYVAPLYEFKDKIFLSHCKDIRIYKDKFNSVGPKALPYEFMEPKLPGLGTIDWGAYISGLRDIGYTGAAVVEVEDRSFEGSEQLIRDSLILSKRYLSQYIV